MPAEDIVDTGRLNSELEDKILPFRPIYGFALMSLMLWVSLNHVLPSSDLRGVLDFTKIHFSGRNDKDGKEKYIIK